MDASYKIQRGLHVHLIQFFMCPEFWVHINDNPLFCFWEDAICALSFFVRFSEKPGFCGYFLGGRTLFRGRRTKTASIGSVATLPANGFPFVSWRSPQTLNEWR